jgi:hypothetical protein
LVHQKDADDEVTCHRSVDVTKRWEDQADQDTPVVVQQFGSVYFLVHHYSNDSPNVAQATKMVKHYQDEPEEVMVVPNPVETVRKAPEKEEAVSRPAYHSLRYD